MSRQTPFDDEAHFRSLVELLPVAVYTCAAPDGRITFYNPNAARLWGREPELGDTDERFCGSLRLWRPDGSALPHAETPMAIAIREGRASRNEEVVIERPDGSRVTVLVNIDPIVAANGDLVGAVNVFHDTTALKQADHVRAHLAAIVESSDDAIISKDLDGIILTWNRSAERLYGYAAEEVIGQPVTMLIPPDRQDEEPAILARVRSGQRVDHYETVRRRKDGTLRDVSLTVSPILDEFGRVTGASKIARDVTEQKRNAALVALEQEATARLYEVGKRCVRPGESLEDALAAVLETAIWIARADRGTLQIFEDSSGALTLMAHQGFEGADVEAFARAESDEGSACGAALALAERVVIEDVAESESWAGPASEALAAAGIRAVVVTPLVSSSGTVLGMISTHFARPNRPTGRECRLLDVLARQAADYLERRRGEMQRESLLVLAEKARAEAEAASRAKDEFLAMLGHELRNPLAAVRNAVAAASLDEASRARALEIARRQSDQLARIVDDLLDVARITRGRVPMRKERISLAEILQRTVDGARAIIGERGHELELVLPDEPIHLEADAARIEQALANLLTNAAKYTDPGGKVTVTAERDGDDAVVRVADSGIGIAPEVLPRVFDLFAQGYRTLDRAQGGLGIGLTLVSRIVELHGGTVAAASEGLGRGSEFTIRLPALPTEQLPETVRPSSPPARPGSDRHPARVLMVEDNPDAAESLVMILELLGHHVRVVHDGSSALEAARANLPDIMLVDIGLPGMNGYEVAQAIRRDATLKHLMLVALTGYGRPEDKAQAIAAGFDYHLVKPVDLEALGDLVARLAMPAATSPGGSDTRH